MTRLASSDEVLKTCELITKTKSEFAELVFPYLVMDIVLSNPPMSRVVSENIRDFLIAHGLNLLIGNDTGETDLAPTQLILSTLNFLRKKNLEIASSKKF